jgi:hypothetical protein
MDEAMLGELDWGVCLCEREQRQRAREVTNEVVLEGGSKIKEKELLLVITSDIHPNSEVSSTPRRSSWR